MFIYIYKIQYILFSIMVSMLMHGCIMHSFDKNGTSPLHLDVKPILIDDNVKFLISESHFVLEKYYLQYIGVITPNKLCESGIPYLGGKGAFSLEGLMMWEYKPKLPKEKINILSGIIYGFKGKSKKLQKNTLYVAEIGIKKIDGNNYQRRGHGIIYFYINSERDVIFAKTSKERNSMCKKFGREVYNW